MLHQIKLTKNQKCDISHSLNMWCNYIETGDVVLSATDIQERGGKVKVLCPEQIKKVKELRELADSIYQSIYGPD